MVAGMEAEIAEGSPNANGFAYRACLFRIRANQLRAEQPPAGAILKRGGDTGAGLMGRVISEQNTWDAGRAQREAQKQEQARRDALERQRQAQEAQRQREQDARQAAALSSAITGVADALASRSASGGSGSCASNPQANGCWIPTGPVNACTLGSTYNATACACQTNPNGAGCSGARR